MTLMLQKMANVAFYAEFILPTAKLFRASAAMSVPSTSANWPRPSNEPGVMFFTSF
jgi:hypothetical protein